MATSRASDKRYLTQQRRAWYLRLRVPGELKAQLGRSEIVETLGTRDLSVAQQRRWARVAHWTQQFALLRGAPAWDRSQQREVYHQELARWQAAAGSHSEAYPVEMALQDWLHDHEHEQGTPGWDAALAFWRSLRPTPEGWQPGAAPSSPAQYQLPVSELAKLYLGERQRDQGAKLTAQSEGQIEAVFRLFADFTEDRPLSTVTREVGSKFLDRVARLDPQWGRSPSTKSRRLADLKDAPAGQGLSNRTLNRYSSALAGLWKWSTQRGHVETTASNPFTGQHRKIGSHRKTGWLPFTDAEVSSLLAAAAELPESDPMRWVPLVGAFSGMRSNEICSLRTNDVRQQDGVWFFDVTGAKTEAGDRRVPIHSRIIEAGLLAYLECLPQGALWPKLKPGGPDKKLNWYMTKQFHALRQRLGIDRERIGFHSFRKSVATKLENARIPESEAVQVLGHEKLSMSYRVYSLGVDLRRLKEIVEVVQYGASRGGLGQGHKRGN